MNEQTWETEEVARWIMNTEPIFNDTEDITHRETMEEVVRGWLDAELGQFAWSKVDWDAIIEERTEL
jgi:hypothetical protein